MRLQKVFIVILFIFSLAICYATSSHAAYISHVRNATDAPLVAHTAIYIPDHTEILMMAKLTYGEARGCSERQRAAVCWNVLNRVDAPEWPDTVSGVITDTKYGIQYAGWSASHPVTDALLDLAYEVTNQWVAERLGYESNRALPKEYTYFTGNGRVNTFRTQDGQIWRET